MHVCTCEPQSMSDTVMISLYILMLRIFDFLPLSAFVCLSGLLLLSTGEKDTFSLFLSF